MDLKSTYNKIAEDWFKDHHKDTWWIEGTDKFCSLLPDQGTILDVGCGAGVNSKYFAQKCFKVTGVDFSENFIKIAKRESPEIEFEVMDIYDLDKNNRTFDGVYAKASLLHIPKKDITDVIDKLKNKLNPGGFLYIAVKAIRESSPDEEIKMENDYGYEYERFFSYYRMDELEKYLKDLNLEIVYKNEKRVGKTDWLQVIGRK